MLTRRFVTAFGIVGLVVMAVLLVVMWFRWVPTRFYIPLFFLAFVIWASRLVMRVLLARKERREAGKDLQSRDPESANP